MSRRHSDGKVYYQARFFDKSGHPLKSLSLTGIESRSEAYLSARKRIEQILIPSLTKEEIDQYGILTVDEVKAILGLPDDKPEMARSALIALLGTTCGLGVSEIRNLKRDQVTQKDMFSIETSHGNILIPFIGKVKGRLVQMRKHFPDSRYVMGFPRFFGQQIRPHYYLLMLTV